MTTVVQKYGGTSVGDIDMIRNVARRVKASRKKVANLVVVVSAMAGETDKLIGLADSISKLHDEREHDVLVSSGEQVTSALLAMTLIDMGVPAQSFLGHQVQVCTDNAHTKARITRVDEKQMRKCLKQGKVVVVAGFQGIDCDGNITTLGRGGSDTTAVALAQALNADVCEIFTDVEGVYTADPRIVSNARKLKNVSFEEMLELASMGSRVLHIRAVEFAMKYKIPIHVRSSLSRAEGTIVTAEDSDMEQVIVSGIAHNKNEAKITVAGVPDQPGVAYKLFEPLTRNNIVVDMIIQNASADGVTDLTFTVPKVDYPKVMPMIKKRARQMKAREVLGDRNIAKVSIVGVGMRSHAGVAAKMFKALADVGINIMMISTSEIKVSCVIDDKFTELAVRVLHDTFKLDKPPRAKKRPGKKKKPPRTKKKPGGKK